MIHHIILPQGCTAAVALLTPTSVSASRSTCSEGRVMRSLGYSVLMYYVLCLIIYIYIYIYGPLSNEYTVLMPDHRVPCLQKVVCFANRVMRRVWVQTFQKLLNPCSQPCAGLLVHLLQILLKWLYS